MKKIIPAHSTLIPDTASCVFNGVIYDVYQWEQKLYDGKPAIFEMLKRPDTISVFAVVDDKIIIIEDEQPHRDMVVALPGGRVDPEDDSTLAAAKRETKEETGYTFENWKLLEVYKPVEKIEWFLYTYIAWGPYKKGEPNLDSGEKITLKLHSFEEVKTLGENGLARFTEQHVLSKAADLQAFIDTPEFEGIEVDR